MVYVMVYGHRSLVSMDPLHQPNLTLTFPTVGSTVFAFPSLAPDATLLWFNRVDI